MRIQKCTSDGNCVSSLNGVSEKNYFPPLKILENPIKDIEEILRKLKIKVVEKNEYYLRAVAVTKFLRFKDDLEFEYLPNIKEFHFKSASRVGRSDFGVNRKRLLKIFSLLKI